MKKRKEPKPFFRKFTQTWYVQLGGKQINLGRDKKAAWDDYHDLLASRRALASVTVSAAQFFESYLDWVEENRAPATYDHATHYLNSCSQKTATSCKSLWPQDFAHHTSVESRPTEISPPLRKSETDRITGDSGRGCRNRGKRAWLNSRRVRPTVKVVTTHFTDPA